MSADKQYAETRKIINNEIDLLKAKLESMDIQQSKDIKNYGYVGNAQYILIELQRLNYDFMEKY